MSRAAASARRAAQVGVRALGDHAAQAVLEGVGEAHGRTLGGVGPHDDDAGDGPGIGEPVDGGDPALLLGPQEADGGVAGAGRGVRTGCPGRSVRAGTGPTTGGGSFGSKALDGSSG